MSLDSAIHLITAMAFAALACALWWQAVPTLKARRGGMQAMGVWLVGMAMACFVTGRLDMAMSGAPVRWSFTAGDVCMIGFALMELMRARNMGFYRWNRCPDECRP